MAARPGEEHVATLYGDVHYFYGPPTDNPPHHRFDKGSYVYLFEDANQGRARLEIANHPGTDDQDAFDGYLDRVHVRYSYKHICLVTITVGEVEGNDDWHLPTYDPQNQNKYHYKLHSLDIYFWTPIDAGQFVSGIRRVLPPAQCEVLDEPGPPPRHEAEMSSVVQKLEQAAISGSNSLQATPAGLQPGAAGAPTFPGPPMSAVAGPDGATPPPPPQQFSPVAYNPAAPPAPEEVRHREKTPPPEDGGANPLHQTLAYDAATPFSPGLVPSGLGRSALASHPPTFSIHPAPPCSPGRLNTAWRRPALHLRALVPSVGKLWVCLNNLPPALASPYGVGTFPSHVQYTPQGVTHTPTPPASGVGVPPPPAGGNDYAVHQQFYIPENKYKPKQETRGKLEENAGRLERGVTGMLKKMEKRFG
ncbi:hypothetical protein NEMBOFW57_002925 [Staphylotrichum longicolle]|uniref:RNA recognition motif-containing protein n=1 Tax=Staphylotrichum longicolle TaxID=669026 RepID=A0AAD4F582_9PEZI|nr:hypothetical protein NEMBOFW57_002925 [Staphylotrichum longicolle]